MSSLLLLDVYAVVEGFVLILKSALFHGREATLPSLKSVMRYVGVATTLVLMDYN